MYVAAPLVWSTYVPGHSFSFQPADYERGEDVDGVDGVAGRPVFRGNPPRPSLVRAA